MYLQCSGFRERRTGFVYAPNTGVAGSANAHETGAAVPPAHAEVRAPAAAATNGGAKAPYVVKSVTLTDGAKVGRVVFDGHEKKQIKFWASAAFVKDLAPGATGTPKFKKEPGKPKPDGGTYPDEDFLCEWNGVGEKSPRGGGGGGGKSWQPRSESENLQIMAQSALKAAVDHHTSGEPPRLVVETAKAFLTGMIDMVVANKGKLAT